MQDRFVGDVGDFAKYGLLRAIRKGKRLGIAWYLHPDRNTEYLQQPKKFRPLDPEMFDEMKNEIEKLRDGCSVKAVEKSGILGDAAFADEPLRNFRPQWFERVKEASPL